MGKRMYRVTNRGFSVGIGPDAIFGDEDGLVDFVNEKSKESEEKIVRLLQRLVVGQDEMRERIAGIEERFGWSVQKESYTTEDVAKRLVLCHTG